MNAFQLGAMPPQVDAKALEKLAQVDVATLGHWRLWGFCDNGISRLAPGMRVVGTAITVSCPVLDNAALHYAVGIARAGDILVVERQNDRDIACAGAVVVQAALQAGVKALIIDGPCTDVRDLRAGELPIWCRGVSGRTTKAADRGGRINHPVSIGGVVVMPGDALLCDDDGIVVLNPAEIEAEASKALESQARSAANLQRVLDGAKLADLNGVKAAIDKAVGKP